jgi:hypothetical protein
VEGETTSGADESWGCPNARSDENIMLVKIRIDALSILHTVI